MFGAKSKKMKSILYIGVTLMVGASVYGFVDYKKTNHIKEFQNLYSEKEAIVQTTNVAKEITNARVVEEPVVKEKIVKTKDLPWKKEAMVQKDLPMKKVTTNNNKEKKLSYKLFSRAPLDRRYLDKELNLEEVRKSEPVKIIIADSSEKKKEQ